MSRLVHTGRQIALLLGSARLGLQSVSFVLSQQWMHASRDQLLLLLLSPW